jgi:hypothetical protein
MSTVTVPRADLSTEEVVTALRGVLTTSPGLSAR